VYNIVRIFVRYDTECDAVPRAPDASPSGGGQVALSGNSCS